ncbi:MAG: hypothetical protein IRZ00_08625 [Gemmatimonadetes bacterium]|nr:hypothetical protein [Gemmatimonadota bacterium]
MIPETRCPARHPTRATIGRRGAAAALLLATGGPLAAQRGLPAVSQLVDSAAVADSAAAFLTRRTVVSVAFDSTGAADWIRAGSMSVTELEDIARSMTFRPGAIDGRLVPIWVDIPLRIERRGF